MVMNFNYGNLNLFAAIVSIIFSDIMYSFFGCCFMWSFDIIQ